MILFAPLTGPVEDVRLIMGLWSERVGRRGLDAVCVYYEDAGRVFIRVESDGVFDAGALARRLRDECGGEGGGGKKSAVWTVKRIINTEELYD